MIRSFILMLAILALASAETTSSTSSTTPSGEPQLVAQYQILGDSDVDPGTKLWDTYDLGLSDLPSYDVAPTLNGASLGAGASSTPQPTTSPVPDDDEGWPWWYYLFIALGGALVLAAIGGLVWYSVNKKKQPAAKDYAPIHPEPEPTAGRRRTAGFPPPHPSSKVIQIPLIHHQVYPLFAETPV